MIFVGHDIMDTKDTSLRLTGARLTQMGYEEAKMLIDRLPVSDPRYRQAQLWLNWFWSRAVENMVAREPLIVAQETPTTPTSGST